MNDTDESLMTRVKTGDDSALAELVRRHTDRAERYARRMLRGDGHGADDVTQECWLRIWRYRSTYKPNQQFLPWFYSVLANCTARHLRRQRKTVDLDSILDSTLEPLTPADTPEHQQYLRRIAQALPHVHPVIREVLTRVVIDGVAVAEVARQLGLSRAVARKRLEYGIESLACRVRITNSTGA